MALTMARSKKNHDGDLPEKAVRRVFDACSDCDSCRFLMDRSCLLFPELYRLYDREKEENRPVGDDELLKLTELCTLCGLCPCPDIRNDVIRSKTGKVRRDGMPLSVRLLADVQAYARCSRMMPGFVNALLKIPAVAAIIKKLVRIHPSRPIPLIAPESFFDWATRKGLDRVENDQPKAVYFAGCTAAYFFPQVARAAVAVLEKNGINVCVPPQQCCGMPTLLEGDEDTTLARVRSNMKILLEAVRNGYVLVCSCPTCGFLMKRLLSEKAYYSEAYQQSVDAGADEIRFPESRAGKTGFVCLKKSMYKNILKDDGYFSGLEPLKRLDLSQHTMDLGEYLERLYRQNHLDTKFGKVNKRVVYFAPCHQREQEIDSPYEKLLGLIPGLSIRLIGGTLDCCGMGGSLGYKKNFHGASLRLGKPLMQKIRKAEPEAIITDCLSCRLQFTHTLPYPVLHPLEVISEAYDAAHLSPPN